MIVSNLLDAGIWPRRSIRPYLQRLMLLAMLASAAAPAGAGEASTGYPSVRAAFDAVRALPGIEVSAVAGWTLLEDRSGAHPVNWSFAPPAHPAYPAVIRRDLVMKNRRPTLVTRLRCEGAQRACDRLYATIQRGESEASTNVPGSNW